MKKSMLFIIVCFLGMIFGVPTKLSMVNLDKNQRDGEFQRGTYLIVLSNPGLYDYFFIDDINFVDLKRTQGYDVDFVSFSSGDDNVVGINGSNAQDLKNYIIDYYAQDPMLEFILLVGDVNQNSSDYNIPTFTVLSYNENEPDQTDYPFTYFDSGDGEDVFSPHFFIGRWSIGNPTDLVNIIYRNVIYNKLPSNYITNPEYLNRGLVVAGNYSGEGTAPGDWPVTPVWTSKWVQGELEHYGYEQVDSAFFHKGNYEWATINPQIENSWNDGVGIVNYRGWGDARGWHKPEFHNSEVQTDLLPSFHLPVVFSFVCNTGDFGNESQIFCFGETLLTAGTPLSPKGAVAMVGPSDLDTDTRFNNVMCAAMWDAILEERTSQLGPALHQGKKAVHYEFKDLAINDIHIGEFYHHVYGVLGDPSLDIWLGEPSNMNYDLESEQLHNSFIDISVSDINGSPLPMVVGAVMYDGELIGKGISNQDGLLAIDFETVPENSQIQVYLNKAQYYQTSFLMTLVEDNEEDFIDNSFIDNEEPEEYGYSMIHSEMDSPNAPVYEWFDLHEEFGTNPNIDNLELTDDSINESVPIGFDFQYYGETYNSLIVCSNGWASFVPCIHSNGCVDEGGNSIVSPYFYNNSITCPIGPYGMLAPFYDDLDDNNGQLNFNIYSYIDIENSKLIIQWNELANGQVDEQCPDGDNCAYETFQLILQARDGIDGDILFQYKDVSDVDDHGCTIGIESPDKNEGLEYLFFNDYAEGYPQLSNNSALLFTMSECIANGDVNGDGNLDVLDINQIVNHMLFGGFSESQQCISNINTDGNIDVLDVILIMNIILR